MPDFLPHTFVLFVDMLGFANLVEEQGDQPIDLNPILAGVGLRQLPAANLLAYRFAHFHRCLNDAQAALQKMDSGTAIIFSDSAFFQVTTIQRAVSLAQGLMRSLIEDDVPVRMGLAAGSFRLLRFLTDTSANISLHVSQFFGTGVVRAYQTERCGVPGLRILLHPNLDLGPDIDALRVVPIETTKPLTLDVRSEVNYLELDSGTGLGPDFDDVILFDSLRWMTGITAAALQYHYLDTFKAWNVMRAQLGRAPYAWGKFLDRDEYDYTHGIRQRPAPESSD